MKKTIPLTCQRCGKEWDYAGKAGYYTSCPNCKTSVGVRKK
jgi:phage FluMu protein Com